MKNALVIGASGGIGSAVAQELETRGLAVTGLSRSGDGLDVTDPASVARVLGALSGPFDVVFVAIGTLAAGGAPEKALDALEADQMARVMAVNAIGPALVMQHIERLIPREGRSVVGVLSARVGSIGDNKIGGWYSYRASKAAAMAFTMAPSVSASARSSASTVTPQPSAMAARVPCFIRFL